MDLGQCGLVSLRNSDLIEKLLQPTGLTLLGSFVVSASDKVPRLADKQPATCLLMIGNGGSSFWQVFCRSEEYLDGRPEPLDRWSQRVGNQIAEQLDGLAIFPFDGPPYFPFQRWAAKTGQMSASRIPVMIHERFGLWHAYRFALVLPESARAVNVKEPYKSACLDCIDRPCLKVCPVDAFKGETYAPDPCVAYLVKDSKSPCRTLGCESRRACPASTSCTYLPDHARFHMDAFLQSQIV